MIHNVEAFAKLGTTFTFEDGVEIDDAEIVEWIQRFIEDPESTETSCGKAIVIRDHRDPKKLYIVRNGYVELDLE